MNQMRYVLSASLVLVVGLVIVLVSGRIKCSVNNKSDAIEIDYIGKEIAIDTPMMIGKSLFAGQCASCHSIFQKVVGPPLANITERGPWKDFNILCKYIRNWTSIKNNNYVDSLHKEYHIRHQFFPNLTNENIKQIFDYIKAEAKQKPRSIP